MDERERRLGLNEAVFREVNERVEDMTQTFTSVTSSFEIVCECGDLSCTERITVPLAVYERVRRDVDALPAPGRPRRPDGRRASSRPTRSFVIVEKQGVEVERVAEQTDPRRSDDG